MINGIIIGLLIAILIFLVENWFLVQNQKTVIQKIKEVPRKKNKAHIIYPQTAKELAQETIMLKNKKKGVVTKLKDLL